MHQADIISKLGNKEWHSASLIFKFEFNPEKKVLSSCQVFCVIGVGACYRNFVENFSPVPSIKTTLLQCVPDCNPSYIQQTRNIQQVLDIYHNRCTRPHRQQTIYC